MPRQRTTAQSWWAERWLAALEGLGWEGRLDRGRTYVKGVRDIVLEPGYVMARVHGSRPMPYRVEVRLPTFDDAVWERATEALAARASSGARLVSGQMPDEAEAAFLLGGASLFPPPEERIAISCSCADWARPCKHAAALFHALAAEMDRDPFVLFALRGRTRDEVLAGMRVARARGTASTEGAPAISGPSLAEELAPLIDRFWEPTAPLPAAEPPESLALALDQGEPAVLHRLGPPPRGLGGTELQRELAGAYRILADRAARLLRRDQPAARAAGPDAAEG